MVFDHKVHHKFAKKGRICAKYNVSIIGKKSKNVQKNQKIAQKSFCPFKIKVFILSGFEQCVANMYCFSMVGMWSGKTPLYALIMLLDNSMGGWPWRNP